MAAQALDIGAEIGPFRILKLLGEGGVGRVYAALDTDLGRMVALKALRPEVSNDTGFVERFRGEAASLARLQHPNITTLYALHRNGRDIYMVMEMVRGYTLEEVQQRQGRLGTASIRALAAQACAGLSYAHRMGVIHRDIKPSNLMLTESGLLKIMDFGIARVRGSKRMTRAGSIVGTLAYMPPEQIKGADNDERSDIYSLGCVFYELLCGSVPFTANTEYELIQAHIGQAPPGLAGRCQDLDPSLDAALQRALAKNPAERFADSAAFARALGATNLPQDPSDMARETLLARMPPLEALDAEPGPARTQAKQATAKRAEPAVRPREQAGPKSWLPAAALGGALVVVVGGAGFMMMPRSAPPPAPAGSGSGETTQAGEAAPATQGSEASTDNAGALPPNPNILPPPDAQASANAGIGAETQPTCPAESAAAVAPAHVDGVSDAGWPEVSGSEMHLFGVRDVSPAARSRLANWLSRKGDEIACCTVAGDAQLCRTTGEHHQDVSMYLLLNGLARAGDGAPQSYLDAEADARAGHRGVWQQ